MFHCGSKTYLTEQALNSDFLVHPLYMGQEIYCDLNMKCSHRLQCLSVWSQLVVLFGRLWNLYEVKSALTEEVHQVLQPESTSLCFLCVEAASATSSLRDGLYPFGTVSQS